MYIKKYWYNYIGGTDDSLTLVDYLYDKGKTEIPLSEIFNDTGLSKLNWNFHISPNLEYIDSEGQCHEFYYAIDLATDLAALILESKKSGGFNIKNLFDGEKRDRFVKIITTPEEDQAMNRALAEFCASPLEYDLHEMVDDEDMLEMAKDCENIRKELCESLPNYQADKEGVHGTIHTRTIERPACRVRPDIGAACRADTSL